ncbi:MAG: hypothetical protein ACU0DB_12090 [Paracoccus sp. (in: a-proteobacteria)]|uniref:hypothetical protein n=1 Tax=Paracoccus sp. TaxID=267 RepID=UPI000C458F79|nr:hypothetical protein [Paracoccus sp. (in: a-proteobacteria)]MBA48927.1 hypothetical protein [Paracoccus sp. (in: a-proteobacteria)]
MTISDARLGLFFALVTATIAGTSAFAQTATQVAPAPTTQTENQPSDISSQVTRQLLSQGYRNVTARRTLLGKLVITARKDRFDREIVIDPRNGAILRDLLRRPRQFDGPDPSTASDRSRPGIAIGHYGEEGSDGKQPTAEGSDETGDNGHDNSGDQSGDRSEGNSEGGEGSDDG